MPAWSIKEASYETSEPTVDLQIVTLQGSGADMLLIGATPKFAAQAIRKTFDVGWTPVRYMTDVSQSIASVMKPAGVEKSKGRDHGDLWQGSRPTRAGRTIRASRNMRRS